MSLNLQILLSGLAAGSVYGLLAVGHTLVYRLTGIVHFALGDLVGLGVFITLFVTSGRGPVTAESASSWRFAAGLVVALLATAALGSGSYFAVIHQYVTRGSTLGWVAATVAIAFAIENTLAVVFQRPAYVFPDPLPFRKAGNVGVPLDRYVGLAFGLVGALAVVIAVAAAPSGPFSVTTGTVLGLKGLVAALVVGFGSPALAFVAGLGLGVVEAGIASGEISGHRVGPSYREVILLAFALLLLA